MTDHAPPAMDRRQRLHHAIHHLEHILPGQAPLADFVHHNTLHGYQHHPFPAALAQARQVTGIYGYLPMARFRQLLNEGRITREDLDSVLTGDPQLREPAGPISRQELFRIALLHDLTPIPPSRLHWELESGSLLGALRPDVEAHARARFLSSAKSAGKNETQAVTDLWQACLEVLDLVHAPDHVEGLVELNDLAAQTLLEQLPQPPDHSLRTTGALRQEADRIHRLIMEQVGHSLTLRGVLLALTGQDLLEELRPYLSRQLAAFLDHGMTPWPLPQRERGFFVAWKQAALADPGAWLENLPDWHETITYLPDDAAAVVEEMLSLMGLPEERWEGYLGRLALELPGWSGMFMWRHLRPGYQGLAPRQPEMMDYLAVRLVLERLTALRLCRRQWKLEPRLELLAWHFHTFRAELVMRWHLFNADQPEYLALQTQTLLRRTEENPALDEEWQHLAHQFLTWRLAHALEGKAGFSTSRHGWALFLLAQHIGWSGREIRQAGRPQAEAMLSALLELDEERAGYLWLQAYERNYREKILSALTANRGRGRWATRESRPQAQLIFCMDDREEGIRRHLEEHNPAVETLGAPGFFGIPMNWQGLDDQGLTPLCPVVVTPTNTVRETPRPGEEPRAAHHSQRHALRLRLRDRVLRHSHRGLLTPALMALAGAPWALTLLAGKLLLPNGMSAMLNRLRERFDLTIPTALSFTAPASPVAATAERPRMGFTDTEQAARVAGMLRTMGLTYGFAPLVVFLGHGSNSQNNPHLAAYDCGACSGRHGGPNARLFAAMANRPEVRALLREQGLDLPDDTWFVGTEHNTCDESILWYDLEDLPPQRQADLAALQRDLEHARRLSAHERARRLASAPRRPTPTQALEHMVGRAVDFSQARPELGHVTNATAFIGRRSVTQGAFFDRRMFLISYDPTQDPGGKIVENILLAAGPVGAGISLEYYFSTVDNDRFGCGTKVVHNVTGFLGVMEGTSSDLRTGLPRQMIEIHEAMRLLVIVEQTPEILTAICQRQPIVAELVFNAWIQLAAMEPESGTLHFFRPGAGWEPWQPKTSAPLPRVANSVAWYDGLDGPLAPALIRQPGEAAP